MRNPGFSLIELLMVVSVMGALAVFGTSGLRSYTRGQEARRAAQTLSWAVTLTRTNAIRAGGRMTLRVVESGRSVTVYDTAGTVWHRVNFGAGSQIPLQLLDLELPGDSIVFSRRGLCLNCPPDRPTLFRMRSGDQEFLLEVSPLGRTQVTRPGAI